jgi:hypothetical protein
LDGEFLLASFTENYSDFLKGMGMPAFVAAMILSARETITLTQPNEEHGFWSMATKTGL